MRQHGVVGLIILCIAAASPAISADGSKVTIATQKGDIVEGIFLAATATEITVEVAGQPLKIPVSSVKYVSFVGVLGAGGADAKAAGPASGTMEAAFAALHKLQETLRVGVLRAQYSEKLVETLPTVNAFIDNGSDWPDVRLALASATVAYKRPLGAGTRYYTPWQFAAGDFAEASVFIAYAESLAKIPSEKDHTESPDEVPLELGREIEGRLGTGDRHVLNKLTEKLAGRLADVYVVNLSGGHLAVTMDQHFGTCGLVLADSAGVAVKVEAKDRPSSELRFDVKVPGKYRIWAAGTMGTYKLNARMEQK